MEITAIFCEDHIRHINIATFNATNAVILLPDAVVHW